MYNIKIQKYKPIKFSLYVRYKNTEIQNNKVQPKSHRSEQMVLRFPVFVVVTRDEIPIDFSVSMCFIKSLNLVFTSRTSINNLYIIISRNGYINSVECN
jgi:hypothetical protein